jgi:excisionase family DNA binding protein
VTTRHGTSAWNRPGDPLRPTSIPNDPDPAPCMLLTSEQAAEYLQVSVRTIKNLMSDAQLAYIKVGRSTRVHRNDIEEYITRNRRKHRHGLRAS